MIELPARGDDNLWLQSNDAYYFGTGDFEMAVEGLHGYIDAIAQKHGHASFCLHPTYRANTRREFDLLEEFVT